MKMKENKNRKLKPISKLDTSLNGLTREQTIESIYDKPDLKHQLFKYSTYHKQNAEIQYNSIYSRNSQCDKLRTNSNSYKTIIKANQNSSFILPKVNMNEGQSSKRSTERHNRSNNDHYYHLIGGSRTIREKQLKNKKKAGNRASISNRSIHESGCNKIRRIQKDYRVNEAEENNVPKHLNLNIEAVRLTKAFKKKLSQQISNKNISPKVSKITTTNGKRICQIVIPHSNMMNLKDKPTMTEKSVMTRINLRHNIQVFANEHAHDNLNYKVKRLLNKIKTEEKDRF